MMWKVRIKLLIDRIANLFKKKKPLPRFAGPLYPQHKNVPQKSRAEVAVAVLLPFVRECGVIVYEDLRWLINRRKEPVEEAWARAAELVKKG